MSTARIASIVAAVFLIGSHCLIAAPQTGDESQTIAQSGADPLPIIPGAMNVLKANLAERSSSTAESEPKGFWIQGWNDPHQSFLWRIQVPRAGEYSISVLVSGAPGSLIEIAGLENKLSVEIDALNRRGIKLMLFYHCGYGDREWQTRNFGTTDANQIGIDALFRKNWTAISTEVGERYGSRLAGWLIDEGWYPSPFEKQNRALKAGYSGRIVSFNDWVRPRLTDCEDVEFGEGFNSLNNGAGKLFPDRPPGGGGRALRLPSRDSPPSKL